MRIFEPRAQHRTLPRPQVPEGEDDMEESQEVRDLCHFIEGEVATGRSFELTQVCMATACTVAASHRQKQRQPVLNDEH